jgi:ribosomal protein L11 methyltransferase
VRRPPRARQRRRSTAVERGAAPPAEGVRALGRRAHLPRRRGLLREAEERLPLSELLRAAIVVPPERVEEAVAQLLELSPAGLAENEAELGVELAVYTDAAGLARLRERFPQAAAEPVAPGWEDAWRRFHVPVVVGPLWVGPPWQTAPPGLVPVVIDPGRAFGTGAHETTRLCLELLLEVEPGSLLDAGCGSGVLAIAAAKLGFGPVAAVDAEQAAVEAVRRNAAANGAHVEARRADVLADPLPAADVVTANLSLESVEALAPRLRARCLITSGYLRSERPRLEGFRRAERRAAERFAADLSLRE